MTTVRTESTSDGPSQSTPINQPVTSRATGAAATPSHQPFPIAPRAGEGASTRRPFEARAADGAATSICHPFDACAATGVATPTSRFPAKRVAEDGLAAPGALDVIPTAAEGVALAWDIAGIADAVVVRVGEATVRLRRVRPGDGPVLTEVLMRMSQRTRWLRFHSPISRFSAAQLRSLTEVDHHDRSVLLAEVEVRQGRWQPVGFAQYARTAPDRAEAAIVLEDAWQRRGIGRKLALRLVEVARAAGITAFTSEVLSENRRTLDFVRALAPRTDGRLLGITVELTSWLDPF